MKQSAKKNEEETIVKILWCEKQCRSISTIYSIECCVLETNTKLRQQFLNDSYRKMRHNTNKKQLLFSRQININTRWIFATHLQWSVATQIDSDRWDEQKQRPTQRCAVIYRKIKRSIHWNHLGFLSTMWICRFFSLPGRRYLHCSFWHRFYCGSLNSWYWFGSIAKTVVL